MFGVDNQRQNGLADGRISGVHAGGGEIRKRFAATGGRFLNRRAQAARHGQVNYEVGVARLGLDVGEAAALIVGGEADRPKTEGSKGEMTFGITLAILAVLIFFLNPKQSNKPADREKLDRIWKQNHPDDPDKKPPNVSG